MDDSLIDRCRTIQEVFPKPGTTLSHTSPQMTDKPNFSHFGDAEINAQTGFKDELLYDSNTVSNPTICFSHKPSGLKISQFLSKKDISSESPKKIEDEDFCELPSQKEFVFVSKKDISSEPPKKIEEEHSSVPLSTFMARFSPLEDKFYQLLTKSLQKVCEMEEKVSEIEIRTSKK